METLIEGKLAYVNINVSLKRTLQDIKRSFQSEIKQQIISKMWQSLLCTQLITQQKLIRMKEEMNKSTIILSEFNDPFWGVDETIRQK